MLQWGRNFAVAETEWNVHTRPRSIKVLQWGRNFAVAETRVHDVQRLRRDGSFNGAATLQLRKPDCRRGERGERQSASMGPQLCSCGNSGAVNACVNVRNSFNGAATLQLRKLVNGARKRIHCGLLQWGRNFAVAETRRSRERLDAGQLASMGPQLCSCGN